MNLTEVIFGQAIRFLPVSGQSGGRLYGINLVRALERRYGFWESPKTAADYDITKGISFLHGFFEQKFVIDKFQVYPNGMLAEAKMPTEAIDEFLDDIIAWGRDEAGFTVDISQIRRAYNSHIEVHSPLNLREIFKNFSPLESYITETIRAYGGNTNNFEMSGLSFNAYNDTVPTPKPLVFSFERRAGKPYDVGFYFSTASLKTADHLAALTYLEEIFASTG